MPLPTSAAGLRPARAAAPLAVDQQLHRPLLAAGEQRRAPRRAPRGAPRACAARRPRRRRSWRAAAGRPAPPAKAAAIAASWARATRSSQAKSLRLRRSGSSPNSASGTRLHEQREPAVAQPGRLVVRMHPGAAVRERGVVARDAVGPQPVGLSLHRRPRRSAARAGPGARAARGSPARAASCSPFSTPSWSSTALQRGVALPPVDPHLARLVDRGDQQPQLDRQQLDVEQVDLDVARDDDALVEHPLEDVGEAGAALGPAGQACAPRAPRGAELIGSPLPRAGSGDRACSRAGRRRRRAARRSWPSRRSCSGSARARTPRR